MADGDGSRNFRSAYYEKLGFCGNEEKNILDILATVSSLELDKFSDPHEKFDLDRHCIEAWKVLLGIDCDRKNPFDDYANVKRVRSEHFQSLKHHLEVLLRHNSVDLSDPGKLITLMYLLEMGRLDSSITEAQLNSDHCRKLNAMATFFNQVSNDLQEAYFIFRNFTKKLEGNEAQEKNQPQ